MTRLFTDGAEMGDTLWADFWAGALSNSAVQRRTGDYSYLTGNYFGKILNDLTEVYVRDATYTVANTLLHVTSLWHQTDEIFSLRRDALTRLTAWVGGVQVATGINPMPLNSWHLVEFWFKMDDAPNGRIVAYLNGVLEIDYTGDTKPGAFVHFDNVRFYDSSGGFGCYHDDLALNDTAGGDDDSWCGDGHVERLDPNANGDVNDWTGSDGDKVNNYLHVDERPPTGDTDYVLSSTPLEQDMYNMSDYTPTAKTVVRVWAEGRARDVAALAGEIKLGVKTLGNVYLSGDIVLPQNYDYVKGDDYKINPNTLAAWTEAQLDAVQFVVECE